MPVTVTDKKAVLDATGIYYKDLNQMIRQAVEAGAKHLTLENICGQRYIGTNLHGYDGLDELEIDIYGTPGSDLGAFMDGPHINVFGNAQDGCGNTMNSGKIVVHGRGGDITGFAARGGEIYIRDEVGYRVGIHMKEYEDKKPLMVIGGWAQDFLGEYMAGGVIILLDLTGNSRRGETSFIGTGMHGGNIYIRGTVDPDQLGKEVGIAEMADEDWAIVRPAVEEYGRLFGVDVKAALQDEFCRLWPKSKRPYGRLYAY